MATALALAAAVPAHAAAADGPGLGGTVEGVVVMQTPHGPVEGKIVAPESSQEKPGRAHTHLRVIVPAKPMERQFQE
jgi:hypothetical protein